MRRTLEIAALLGVLALLGHFLASAYVLHPDSDPVRWFTFGRRFGEEFGTARLAYAFPLLVALAIAVAGPFYAFLVNVPVLIALAALLFLFARAHVPRGLPGGGPERALLRGVAGFTALACFVAWNTGSSSMLLRLANPYRDALSYLLLLGSGWLLLRVDAGRGGRAAAAASGAALALACSARETSALFGLPLAALALSARRGGRAGPRFPYLALAAGFAVAIVPLGVQNQLASGSPLLPGQLAANLAASEQWLPGWGAGAFAETFPRTLERLPRHYGVWGLALVALGVAGAIGRGSRAGRWLSAPAFALYLLFYGAYRTVVPRYLSVLDLFAASLAGLGAATAGALLLHLVREPRARILAARGALALAALFAVAVALAAPNTRYATLYEIGRDADRLRLADVRALRAEIERVVPPGALLVTGRPLASLFRCFFDHPVQPLALQRGSRNLRDPERSARVAAAIAAPRGTAFAVYGAQLGETDAFEYFLRSAFDLVPAARLPAERYRLGALYPGRDAIHVAQIAPWSRRESAARLPSGPEAVLAVDVGLLSRHPRRYARLRLGGEVLDEAPLDHVNYYLLPAAAKGARELRLDSDGPLPAALAARLLPAADPVLIDFQERAALLQNQSRLSPDFFEDTHLKVPVMYERGAVRIPTFAPRGSAFLVHVVISVMGEPDEIARHRLRLALAGRRVREGELGPPLRHDGRFGTLVVSFAAPGAEVAPGSSLLAIELDAPPGLGRPPRLALQGLEVYRHALVDPLVVTLGDHDEPYLLDGFGDAVALPSLALRGAGAEASLRLLVAHPDRDAELRAAYLVPPQEPERRPLWLLNGRPLAPRERRLETLAIPAADGGSSPERVLLATDVFDVAAGRLSGFSNVLALRAPFASDGDEEPALFVHRVELATRAALDARP